MLITLYKMGELHFRLLGTNGVHVKAKNERFTAAGSRCRQNLWYENFTSSFGRLRQNIAPKSVPHVQHEYFSSLNQSNHWFVASSLTLPSSNLIKLRWRKNKSIYDTVFYLKWWMIFNSGEFSKDAYIRFVSWKSAGKKSELQGQTGAGRGMLP